MSPATTKNQNDGVRATAVESKSRASSLVELVWVVAVAVALALLIQAFVVKPYRIPSRSMEPTLVVGQRVLVNRISMNFSQPHVGGMYVFHPPADAEQQLCGPVPHKVTPGRAACAMSEPRETSVNFVKRLVAGPGDEIYVSDGHVFRKAPGSTRFVAEKDSYIAACGKSSECNFLAPIKIPAEHWFMMGDNRGESDDSRFWGPVPTGWIIGEVVATYWPPSRVGIF